MADRTATLARTTFATVPPEAADVLRPVLPGLADEIIAAIADEVPDYARAMSGTFGQMVRHGVEVALNRFIDLVADPAIDVKRASDTYVNLGRGEFHAGRSLDALLAAYRVGARHAWRRFVEVGSAEGLSPEAMDSIATRLARRIGAGAVGGAAGGLACVFLADPDAPGRRRLLRAIASEHDGPIARGPTVPWARTADSLRRAAAAYRLAAAGRVASDELVVAEDHLATLLLGADRALAADLAASRLAPLADLAEGPRARLTETLRAWLHRPGQVQAVAAELGVHPQTVRSRLRQLP